VAKNINKLLLIDSKSERKKLFFLNPAGYMEQIWLLLPKNSAWQKLSPKVPTDLNSKGYLNYYSQIDNHVVTINEQQIIFLIGYTDCDEVNLFCYHPEEDRWKKLNSPEVGPIFGVTKYDVIRTNVITVDGKPNISLCLRSAGGIALYLYDTSVGSWSKISGTPNWSNSNGWGDPSHYTTIETQVIQALSENSDDGEQSATTKQNLLIIGRAVNGVELHCYSPESNAWEELPKGPDWGDKQGFNQHKYYSTFQTKILVENNKQKLYISIRFNKGTWFHSYDFASKTWPSGQQPNCFSDQDGWVHECYYSTINYVVIKTADQENKLFLLSRNCNNIDLKFYTGSKNNWFTTTTENLAWSDALGWNQREYYSSIGVQALREFGEADRDNLIAYTKSPLSNNLEIYIYKVAEDSWSKLIDGPNIFAQEWHNPNFYRTKKAVYEDLCVAVKNSKVEQVQGLLAKNIDLFYGVQFKIILDNYKLYLIDSLDENNFTKIAAIKEHALVLLNDNRVYFIKNGRIERDCNYQPKWILVSDRKGLPTNNKAIPILQIGDKSEELIEMVLSQVDLDLNIARNASDIPIDYYQQSPIGLALELQSEQLVEMVGNLTDACKYSDEFSQQAAVYFYLVAKQKNPQGLFSAKRLMDLFLAQKSKPDLNFLINKNIIDASISGQKDLFEIAILNKNIALIEWMLSEKYIKEKIFNPEIKHLKLALQCFQIDSVQSFLNVQLFKLKELIDCVESKFFANDDETCYLEHLKNFHPQLYMLLGKHIFCSNELSENQPILVWLLEQGFWFDDYESSVLPLVVANISSIKLDVIIDGKNYGLIASMLQSNLMNINYFVEYLIQNNINIDIELLDYISDSLVESLQTSANQRLWLKLFELSTKEVVTIRLWDLLVYVPDVAFKNIITTMFARYKQNKQKQLSSTFSGNVSDLSTLPFTKMQFLSNLLYGRVNSSHRLGLLDDNINQQDPTLLDDEFNISKEALLGFLYFAEQGNILMVKRFLDLDPKYSTYFLNGNNKTTALIIACTNNDISLVRLLLSKMNIAQINKATFKSGYYHNITALWISLAYKNNVIIELILNQPGIITEHGKGWHNSVAQGKLLSYQDLDLSRLHLSPTKQVERSLPYYQTRVAPVIMLEETRVLDPNNDNHDVRNNNSLRPR
jgi:hypothetical protein